MSFALQPPGAGPVVPGAISAPVAAGGATTPAAPGAAAGFVEHMSSAPTVQADVAKAARRYDELRQMGRELHFRVENNGQVVIDVCTLDGTVLRTVPPAEGMAIVAGAPPDGGSGR